MANPNIVAVTAIYGQTTGITMSTTANTVLLVNATGSGKVLKVESVLAANITSAATNVIFGVNTSASGGGTTNFLRADGTWTAPSGGGGFSSQVATLAGDQATAANTTPVTLTGLVFTYEANSKY